MAIPSTQSPWRSGDRALILTYLAWPASAYNLTGLTTSMNRVATDAPDIVLMIQGWIDEIETLQQDWADLIADGTAHLGSVAEYEGPAPGVTVTRETTKKRADVLEWDTSLYRSRIVTGNRADATKGGVMGQRIMGLKGQIFTAIGVMPNYGGAAALVRS